MPLADLAPGELAIYVSVDDRFAGTIVMRDQVREKAGQALHNLGELGIERMLVVTGDVAATAESIAHQLGIDEVHAECLPGGKVRIVTGVRPRPLIMVGDGLNDAPVLVAAFGFLPALLGAWHQEVVDLVAILGALRAVGPRSDRGRPSSSSSSEAHRYYGSDLDRNWTND